MYAEHHSHKEIIDLRIDKTAPTFPSVQPVADQHVVTFQVCESDGNQTQVEWLIAVGINDNIFARACEPGAQGLAIPLVALVVDDTYTRIGIGQRIREFF